MLTHLHQELNASRRALIEKHMQKRRVAQGDPVTHPKIATMPAETHQKKTSSCKGVQSEGETPHS